MKILSHRVMLSPSKLIKVRSQISRGLPLQPRGLRLFSIPNGDHSACPEELFISFITWHLEADPGAINIRPLEPQPAQTRAEPC
jgi:hypothetical protein